MKRLGWVVLGSPLVLLIIAIIYLVTMPGGAVGLLCVLPAAAVLVVPAMILISTDPKVLRWGLGIFLVAIFLAVVADAGYQFVLILLNRGDEVSWIPALILGIIASAVLSVRYRVAAIASLVLGLAMFLLRLSISQPITGLDGWIGVFNPDNLDVLLIIIGAITYLDHSGKRVAKRRWRSYSEDNHLEYEEAKATFGMKGDCGGRPVQIRAAGLDSGSGTQNACTVVEAVVENPLEASFLLKWRLGIFRVLGLLFPHRARMVRIEQGFDRFYYMDSHPEGFLGEVLMPSVRNRLLRARPYQITLEGSILRLIKWGYEKNPNTLSETCSLTIELADRIEDAVKARAQHYFAGPS